MGLLTEIQDLTPLIFNITYISELLGFIFNLALTFGLDVNFGIGAGVDSPLRARL